MRRKEIKSIKILALKYCRSEIGILLLQQQFFCFTELDDDGIHVSSIPGESSRSPSLHSPRSGAIENLSCVFSFLNVTPLFLFSKSEGHFISRIRSRSLYGKFFPSRFSKNYLVTEIKRSSR